jgi:hypothetical protein
VVVGVAVVVAVADEYKVAPACIFCAILVASSTVSELTVKIFPSGDLYLYFAILFLFIF